MSKSTRVRATYSFIKSNEANQPDLPPEYRS